MNNYAMRTIIVVHQRYEKKWGILLNPQDFILYRLSHYDTSYEYDLSMYDHLPYKRDSEQCNRDTVRLVSGNVYRRSNYNFVNAKPYVYTAPDMVFPTVTATVDIPAETEEIYADTDENNIAS